ncbi:hypothetical protein QYM36_002647 [Artemia franciscana]|uniref:DUF4371 domain-containing protein n=1 Tax=Artemia franciscana TaxID=6661 RepID=A0AA88I5H8_ARTSF|nr:hypothetical protein QYM36_002647 [Artemia franciscana]
MAGSENRSGSNEAHFFGVFADGTPTVSHEERLAIGVRYVDVKGAAKERLLTVVDSESKKRIDLSEKILQVIRKLGINEDKLAFQCYDFASNISGRFEGAQAQTSKKLRKNAPYLRIVSDNVQVDWNYNFNKSIQKASRLKVNHTQQISKKKFNTS